MVFPTRRSVRLQTYDYSSCGAYFVTICTHDRRCLFGTIQNKTMVLSQFGKIAVSEILNTQKMRNPYGVFIEKYIVMPNHIHMIVFLTGKPDAEMERNIFSKPAKNSLPTIIGAFKSAVTRNINNLCKADMARHVPTVWQPRYYEHIIRNDDSYLEIWEYIENNTLTWKTDKFYTP